MKETIKVCFQLPTSIYYDGIIFDWSVIAIAIAFFIWHTSVSWKKYARKRFTYKLKYGDDWHYQMFPEKYTSGTGPR